MIHTDGRATIAHRPIRDSFPDQNGALADRLREAADGDPGEQGEAEVIWHADSERLLAQFRPVTVHVDRIVAYENGELSSDEALQLIADLVRSGQVWHLQGSYGRFAAQLIMAGRITDRGEIVEVDD